MKFFISSLVILFCIGSVYGQWGQQEPQKFTRADSLRGQLTPLRTAYDVVYYHLDVKIDTTDKSITGKVQFLYRVMENTNRIQIDLFDNMIIDKITDDKGKTLTYEREHHAVFVTLADQQKKGSLRSFTVEYHGFPIMAKRAPWDGGFDWKRDKQGRLHIATACQEMGASFWWPTKDHQSDEPDSMLISITVPEGLQNISNGRLRSTLTNSGWTTTNWIVKSPINNYNVSVNIGSYAYFNEIYTSKLDGSQLTLDYYVLDYNLEKAKKQFEQVKPMFDVLEAKFGKYPFYKDGFKLIETPHLGMEHQSAVAYGNNYYNGYRGGAPSKYGVLFDYIIIHETAHEWWGNHVTTKDIADMWIHESFGTYTESVYVEGMWGYDAAIDYMNGFGSWVRHDKPIVGNYDVNNRGSGDMYQKGSLMLNSIRTGLNNDELWWNIMRGIQKEFGMKTTTGNDVIDFMSKMAGKNLKPQFEQYLKHPKLPILTMSIIQIGSETMVNYRWNSQVEGFDLPVWLIIGEAKQLIIPTKQWQQLKFEQIDPKDIRPDTDRTYMQTSINRFYRDPNAPFNTDAMR